MGRRLVYPLTAGALFILGICVSVFCGFTSDTWWQVGLFAIVAGIYRLYPVVLPTGTTRSLGGAFVLAAMVAVHPFAGIWVSIVTALLPNLVEKQKRSWQQALYDLAQFSAASTVAGFGIRLVPPDSPLVVTILLRVAIGALVFAASNSVAQVLARLLAAEPVWTSLRARIADAGPRYLYMTAMAVLVALAYVRIGPICLLVFLGMLWWSHRMAGHLREKQGVELRLVAAMVRGVEGLVGNSRSHAAEVARLSRQIAVRLDLSLEEQVQAELLGYLHDIGETHVPTDIVRRLYKGKVLTLEQAGEYRKHAEYGCQMLQAVPGMERVAEAIRSHHECFDGSGYPRGLAGEEIPLLARIVGGVEAFLNARAREDSSHGRSDREIIEQLAGTTIDPVVAAILSTLPFGAVPHVDAVAEPEADPDAALLGSVGRMYVLPCQQALSLDVRQLSDWPLSIGLTRELLRRAVTLRTSVRDSVHYQGRYWHVEAAHHGDQIILIAVDLSSIVMQDREHRAGVERAYQTLLPLASGGKIELLSVKDMEAILAEGERLLAVPLDQVMQLGAVRTAVAERLAEVGLPSRQMTALKLIVSEATTNVFKHAGRGEFYMYRLPWGLRFVVADSGPGIPIERLPQALLQDGFSTQQSMGKGFSVILKHASRVRLATSSAGTTVVLEFDQVVPAKEA